jgi:UDP-GlcNAc:undecaprenyl-phosphate/decaprenyl-phosphate GlcNAc-1-phosphate transferase
MLLECFWLDIGATTLGFEWVDYLSGYGVLVLLVIAYVANILGDDLVLQLSSVLMASLAGFVFNFPLDKIFMGDGGAYFVGFMMIVIRLMLGIRNGNLAISSK